MAHKGLLACLVKGEMYQAEMSLGNFGESESMPTVVLITDLDTYEDGLLICNEIIKSSFVKVAGGYVGRAFLLKAGEIRPDKRYRDIEVSLMEEI